MNFKIGEESIIVNLENKVYVEIMGSGVGKTYLYKLLSSQSEKEDCTVCGLTYVNDIDMTEYVLRILNRRKYEFIFLDRYDLYVCKEINDCLEKLAKDTPILLDIKYTRRLGSILMFPAILELKESEMVINDKNGLRR